MRGLVFRGGHGPRSRNLVIPLMVGLQSHPAGEQGSLVRFYFCGPQWELPGSGPGGPSPPPRAGARGMKGGQRSKKNLHFYSSGRGLVGNVRRTQAPRPVAVPSLP